MADRTLKSALVALHESPGRLSFGPFCFDPPNGILSCNGSEVALAPREVRVLKYLLERHGQVVSKQDLLDEVWADAVVEEATLAEAVKVLRRALDDDPRQPTYIQTVHRRGYRFIAPVSTHGAASVGDEDEERLGIATAVANATALVARAVSQRKQLFVWSLVSLAIGIVVGGLWVSGLGDAGSLDEPRRPTQFSITPEELATLEVWAPVALSPDGRDESCIPHGRPAPYGCISGA